MSIVKRFFVLALVALVMVACNKDQELISENNNNPIVKTDKTVVDNSTTKKRACASDAHMEQLLQNDDYKRNYDKRKAKFERQLRTNVAESRALCSNPKVLPVAVHYQGTNADRACLVALAKTQIEILNADFQGKNSDIVQWTGNAAATFPGVNFGEACIEFCLASKNHPSGYNLNDGDAAVTINQTNGDQINQWSGYINIIVNDADGALGYSPLGGSGNGDGVVINRDAFGAGNGCTGVSPQSPYDLGRTLTHELGHYLNLDHIWGEGCGQDDGIADTPSQDTDNSGCPTIGKKSCGTADLHMNYMDYTNDACMYMFTAGQAGVMESWMNANLNLKAASEVCGNITDGGGTDGGGTDGGGTDGGGTDGGGTDGGGTDGGGTDGGGTDGGGTDGGGTDGGGTDNECTAPTNSAVVQINATDIRVDWEDIADAIRYQIQYRPQGGAWTRKAGANSQKRINGLVEGTTYEYRIRTRCADNTWTSYSSISSYTLPGGGDNGDGDTGSTSRVQIKVTLDDFGSETSFAIEDGSGNVVKSWGPFADGQNGTTKTRNIDLPTGVYTFVIFDEYGDGICCDWGDGSWIVNVDGAEIASSNGVFGQWEEFDFAIGGARLSGPASRKDAKDYSRLLKTAKYESKAASK